MFKIGNKSKTYKFIYNMFFWILGGVICILFLSSCIYIWSKFNLSVSNRFISSQILDMFNFLIYFNIVLSVIGFSLNMFVFNREVKRVIDKEYYGRVALAQSIVFIVGIVCLSISPILLKASNLMFDNYKVKTIYCMSYCTLFMGAFFFFYLFSFLNLIAEDESYNKAKAYVYRINKLSYKDIYKLVNKHLDKSSITREFFNSYFKIDYSVVKNECSEFVYAFIKLKEINEEFLKLYNEDRLFDFVNHLYKKVLDKKKVTKIMYFICVDEYNENFKDLIDLSIYQDEHFCVVHSLIDLKSYDLYIGGVRDDEKKNIKDYITVRDEIVRVLSDVIEKN